MKAAILKKIGHFQTNSAVNLSTGHIWYLSLDGLWLYFWYSIKNTAKCHQEKLPKYGRCSNWPLNSFENDRYFLWIIFIGIFRGESSKEKSERSTQSSRRANDTKNSTRAWMCKAYINNRTKNQGSTNVGPCPNVPIHVRWFFFCDSYLILHKKCYFGLWNDFPLAKNYFLVQNYSRLTVLLQYSDLQLFLLYIDLFN